jgi:hypothetical protein
MVNRESSMINREGELNEESRLTLLPLPKPSKLKTPKPLYAFLIFPKHSPSHS